MPHHSGSAARSPALKSTGFGIQSIAGHTSPVGSVTSSEDRRGGNHSDAAVGTIPTRPTEHTVAVRPLPPRDMSTIAADYEPTLAAELDCGNSPARMRRRTVDSAAQLARDLGHGQVATVGVSSGRIAHAPIVARPCHGSAERTGVFTHSDAPGTLRPMHELLQTRSRLGGRRAKQPPWDRLETLGPVPVVVRPIVFAARLTQALAADLAGPEVHEHPAVAVVRCPNRVVTLVTATHPPCQRSGGARFAAIVQISTARESSCVPWPRSDLSARTPADRG